VLWMLCLHKKEFFVETAEAIVKIFKELSEVISWPIVLLVCAIVFRSPITSLINRITKAQHGASIIEAPIVQSQVTSGTTKGVDELGKIPVQLVEIETDGQTLEKIHSKEKSGAEDYLQSFNNPLIKEVEDRIITDIKSRNIIDSTDKEKVLIRALASTQLILQAERIYAGIWGSQVSVLRFLNGRTNGADISALRPFYDSAKDRYPDWYKAQTFEKWLSYLTTFNIIKVDGSHAVITTAGRQFLRYMADAGKPERVYG